MSQEKISLQYSPQLDGLRGLAILSVMGFHAGAPFLKGGFVGVDIFFILSGFLITSLLVSEFDLQGSISLKNFYMRRILRLAPALILLLLIFCLASFLFLNQKEANSHFIDSLISLFYLSNWARAFSIHPPDFLGHTWSLSVEEQFYIIWPILLLTLLRSLKTRWKIVLLAIFIAILAWALRLFLHVHDIPPQRLYNGLDTRADALMIGCAFGVAHISGFLKKVSCKQIFSKVLTIASPVSAICLLTFSIIGNWEAPYMYQFGFLAIGLLTIILIMDIMNNQHSIIRKLLAMKFFVWVGSISYGLYLWHYPIYRTMSALKFSGLSIITLGSLITFIVAVLSYYWIERPIQKLKKHFTHKTPNNNEVQPAFTPHHIADAA